MFKKIYMPFLLSCILASMIHYIHAGVDESDLQFMPRPQLVALIKEQHQLQDSVRIYATLKGIAFGMAATYAALWFFNINPQTGHKTLLKALLPL